MYPFTAILYSVVYFSVFYVVKAESPIRLCVPQSLDTECISMRQDVGQAKIACVFGRDRMHCMQKVETNKADLVSVNANDAYVAGTEFNLVAFVMEEIKRSEYIYEAAAVVKKNSAIHSLRDLRRKNSCHTGLGRTAGWNVPIGTLLASGVMEPDCRGEMYTVAQFFNSSCAPGTWSPSAILNAKLKHEMPKLCSLCDDPKRCLPEDRFAGYAGALTCLTSGNGDVAFTKTEAVRSFLEQNPREIPNLQYLCLDGSRRDIDSPCVWAGKPTQLFMGRSDNLDNKSTYQRTLSQLLHHHKSRQTSWFEKVLVSGSDTTDFLVVPSSRQSWRQYLGNYTKAIEKTLPNCRPKSVSFCVTSEAEYQKCVDMSKVAYSRDIRPNITCIVEASHEACIDAVANRRADVMTLDGGDIFRAGRDKGLKPIAQEIYGESEASYFAVAVVKEKSKIDSVADLKGRRSCHPSIGQTAGWVVPVATLLDEQLIPEGTCNRLASVANFFSASCLPGSNNTRFNENHTIANIMCKLCIGDEEGENKCSRYSEEERYSGEAGAMRCLAENQGDVAFLQHTTALDLTDGRSRLPWTNRLVSSDYKLLCRKGGTANLNSYETCNLARVPSHHVMISEKASEESVMDSALLVVELGSSFGPKSRSSKSFNLFGDYHLINDLIFKDQTTSIRAVELNATYESVLGFDFNQAMKLMDPLKCQDVSSSSIAAISPLFILCIFAAAIL